MKVRASRKNLKKYSRLLLGPEWSPLTERKLIQTCLNGFIRTCGHLSHDQFVHLWKINDILKGQGVDGIFIDRHPKNKSNNPLSDFLIYTDLDMLYCDRGARYAETILYYNGRFCIGDWGGSLAEFEKWHPPTK